MSDHDAFMKAICEEPGDDVRRLVFADYLDENGDPQRAEYIRAQIAAARAAAAGGEFVCAPKMTDPRCACERCRNESRAAVLFGDYWFEWRKGPACARCGGCGGGVYGLEETEWDCERCRGSGDAGGLVETISQGWCPRCDGSGEEPWSDDPDNGPKPCASCKGGGEAPRAPRNRVEFRRGFPFRIHCHLSETCGRDDPGPFRVTEWAKGVVRHHPVTEFWTEHVPVGPIKGGPHVGRYFWLRRDWPAALWSAINAEMSALLILPGDDGTDGRVTSPSVLDPNEAKGALARALASVVREAAGLPRLVAA